MADNRDVRVHPTMDVAFHWNHDFRPTKFSHQRRIARALAVIPLTIKLCKRVNVVCDRVGVHSPKNLSGLKSNDARSEPAATLINRHCRCGSFEFLPFESALY